jgi:hypothetical protein
MWRREDTVLTDVSEERAGTSSMLVPALSGSSLADFLLFSSTLKMEEIRFSETSLNTISTRRHIPEEYFLHSHRRENLKSYNLTEDY